MDISFSNVLEGARQYFQGLPAATASTGSPSTTTQQQNQQNQQQQNQHHQQQQNQRQQQQNQHPPPQNHQQKPQIQQNQSRTHLQHLTQQIPQRVQQHHHLPQQHQQQRQHHQHLQQQRIQQQQQQQRLQQHQQQRLQQQHHQQQHRDSDGSVRSEQHSAVPYWDQQQNEGQGTHLPNNSMVPPQQKQNYYGSQYQSYYEVQSKSQQPPQQNQTPVSSYNYPNQQNHTYPSYPTTNNSFSSPISYNYKVYSQQPNYYQDYRGGQQRTYQSSEANQYYPSNSYPNQNYVQKTTSATQNYPAKSTNQQKMMVVKQKRESPLDLSVKTVKTSADSTLLDYEDRKYRSLQYPQQQQIRAPKVDFLPNFSSTPQPKYYNYAPTTSTSLPRMDFPVKNSQDYIPPEKIPKMEPWRQTIDQQIEQKLSAYSKSHEYLNRPKVPQQLPPQQLPPQKANKKVLSILRTSLQNKGARKLEQEQLIQRQIQQPSTDVMAPLQPKPGIVGRRNISPFTAASLERTSNTPPYKLCIPKAIDSIIYEKKDATDLDGLAAFLAARIRTKAELKQVEETVNNNSSPPKLLQPKVRTEIRSSSETSVFDFPDSDNETERQSLGEMRKDRKTVPNQIQLPPSPSDDMFNKTCDSFMEQLRSPKKARKKKNKTRSDSDSDAPLIQLKVKEGNTDTEEVDERKENWGVEEKPVVPNWEEEEDKKPELVPHWEEEKKPDVQNWEEDKKPEIIPQWEEEKKEDWSEDKKPDITNWEENKKLPTWEEDVKPTILITKPAKKPTFGDGSDFQPGWEEDLYKYKKSLRMPRTLIQINRPPNTHRLSTSLPDLDPYPISPSNCDSKKDSDLESNCSYANDSEGSLKNSILDKLLERYGGKKRKRLKNDPPKTIQPPKTSLIRILKEKATIREVFGEDRPASAPPITCLDDLDPKGKENDDVWSKQPVVKTPDKKRGKRKFSSGFDYIRKKKKAVKKEDTGEENKAKKRGNPTKTTPGSVQDIQKEIKMWVLNKGVGETHLHRASRSGFTDITAYCLEKMACSPSPRDNAGYTPLHEACSKGHLDIARLLLQYGAAVSESAQGGIRPLHEAAENGYVEIVRLLLSYGADPTLATYSGITPIQLAVDKSEQTVTLLQQHLDELQGKGAPPWRFNGPADFFDDVDVGYDPLEDPPETDPLPVEEDIEMEVSEQMLPNLYALPDCDTDRWVLLQDLSNLLKIKSKETLLRQLNSSASSSSSADRGSDIKEMKTAEFLETARCCQFLHANEKLNTRSAKILLVKYTEKVKRLLNVEDVVINVR